jgi:large subunit ribosomal protein L10
MAKTREQKEAKLAELTDAFGRIEAAVFTNYHGLSVRDIDELRSQMREAGMEYHVVKNTIFKRAADAAGIKLEELTGPAGIALGFDDSVATAKLVNKFSKDHEALEIHGGIVEGKEVGVDVIKKLAALPGREELLSRLVGSISSPPRKLATVLAATTRNLVYALTAVKEAK